MSVFAHLDFESANICGGMIDDFRAQVHKSRESGNSVGFRGRMRQALDAVALARPSRL